MAKKKGKKSKSLVTQEKTLEFSLPSAQKTEELKEVKPELKEDDLPPELVKSLQVLGDEVYGPLQKKLSVIGQLFGVSIGAKILFDIDERKPVS